MVESSRSRIRRAPPVATRSRTRRSRIRDARVEVAGLLADVEAGAQLPGHVQTGELGEEPPPGGVAFGLEVHSLGSCRPQASYRSADCGHLAGVDLDRSNDVAGALRLIGVDVPASHTVAAPRLAVPGSRGRLPTTPTRIPGSSPASAGRCRRGHPRWFTEYGDDQALRPWQPRVGAESSLVPQNDRRVGQSGGA